MDTNIKYLVDNNINIWNKDAYNWYCKRYNTTPNNAKKDGFFTLDEFISTIKNRNKKHPVLGNLGRIYGAQWRDWERSSVRNNIHIIGLDQISNLIKGLKENPMGTRHIVTAWNPAELNDMALPPCHWSFEILVEPLKIMQRKSLWKRDNYYKEMMFRDYNNERCHNDMTKDNVPLHQFTLKWHQRSVDTFLGLPFNIASYALLAHIIGKITNMVPKTLIGDLSNVHIYEPHMNAVNEQLSRNTDKYWKPLKLKEFSGFKMDMREDINQWLNSKEISDFNLINYESYPSIKAEMLAYNK